MKWMKWLLACIAVAALLTVGWFFYTNQPVATLPVTPPVTPIAPALPVTPVAPPVSPVTPVTPPTLPAPVIPTNFIVPDEVWRGSSRLISADGIEVRGAVSFSNVPVGTRLYAPVDGWHVDSLGVMLGGQSYSMIVLSQSPRWVEEGNGMALVFYGPAVVVLNSRPNKGEAFVEIKEVFPFPTRYFKQGVELLAMTDNIWRESSDRSIMDPRSYFKTTIEKIN